MSGRLNLEEGNSSSDLFSDSDPGLNVSNILSPEEDSDVNEPEPSKVSPEWKGVSLDEIYKGREPFDFQELPHIHYSATHTVLFALPFSDRGPPKPYPSHSADKWSPGYVRMPHSPHNLYSIEKSQDGKNKELRRRWEVIQEALLQSFKSSFQLEAAILSYNNKHAQRWNFSALHHMFSEEEFDEDETEIFFTTLLPKIIQLALQLPTLITGAIPLLTQHTNASISLSQLQVASLLANAFLCTFPRRNSTNPQSEYGNYPYINFHRLFSAYRENKLSRYNSVVEKLKCIIHYFRRVTTKAPGGTITIQRRYIPKTDCPRWDQESQKLPALHITSKGKIESEGAGLLQVDFANKFVGGGVLQLGCVQEEIRFVVCPELLVTMLVTEVLDDTEALVVSGVERFSNYEGYSNSFKWTGDFVDETPRDSSGRRKTSVVAMDALSFRQPSTQFKMSNVIRELNKAYVGFYCNFPHRDNLPAVATGNWGCGAFHGNPQLKVLLQMMAAASAGRSIVYFTFGDDELRDSVSEMYWHLIQQNVDIGQLFSLISQYQESRPKTHQDFYRFLYNKSKMKPIKDYFTKVKTNHEETPQVNNLFSAFSKITEKRKYEGNISTVKPKNKIDNEIDDETIAKWFENASENENGDSEAITSELNQVENDKIEDSVKEKDFRSEDSEKNLVKSHMSERNCTDSSKTQNQSNTTPKKKPSLWNLPMYEDSKKLNKEHKDSHLPERDEEKMPENKSTELLVNNSNDGEVISKNKLYKIQTKNSPSTKGQKKISDFFSLTSSKT